MAREAIRSSVTLGSVTLPPRMAGGEASFKTSASVKVDDKKVPFFKTGKLLRDRLNQG